MEFCVPVLIYFFFHASLGSSVISLDLVTAPKPGLQLGSRITHCSSLSTDEPLDLCLKALIFK